MVADVTMLKGGNGMVVTGKGYGQTNLIALDAQGNILDEKQLRVEPGQSVLVVQRGEARASYSCNPWCMPTVQLGDEFEGVRRGRRADSAAQRLRDGQRRRQVIDRRAGGSVRRLIVEQPTSQAAIWSVRFAEFAIAATAVAIGLARLDLLAPGSALTVFGASLTLALLAMLLAGSAAAAIWRTGRRGAGRAALGSVLALALMGYPAFLTYQAIVLPKIADVTTDFAEPPSFLISFAARKARGDYAPPPYNAAQEAAQRAAYPDIAPLFVDLEAPQAYQLALRVAKDAGWRCRF